MTKVKTTYNRRSFFKITAATGGGMLLGFSWLASCNPTKEEMLATPSKWFDINAYLKIGDTGRVTIFSPNPEIGQNVKTSMPMIIAEELEVAWKNVDVEQAALNSDWYSRQVAGGSQSIRHGWESLRMAGATAREMLKEAAATQWEVEASTLTVKEGVITNEKGETLHYGQVAEAASKLEAPEEVELKDAKDYTIIGTSQTNVDLGNIITGKPLFGIDTKREGMQYAVVMRAPAFGQKIDSIDDSSALKVNGVSKVIQFTVPTKEQGTADKVAVVANSTWAAMKGKKALKVVWKTDSPAENTTTHEETLTAMLGQTPKKDKVRRSDGDIQKAFAEADQVIERTYESPFLPHNCMEPMNFFAHVTDEKVDTHGPIQTPEWTRSRIADMLGMVEEVPEGIEDREAKVKEAYANAFEKIHVGMSRMGGGFGRRLYGDFALEAVQVSKMVGTPIQLVFSREDDMTAGTYRPAIKYRIKAAIKDKQITGYQLIEAAVNSNMYGVLPNNFPAGSISNYQVDNHLLPSNITIGAWRAPYTNFLGSAEQSFFDEVAEIIEKDPVDLRLEIYEQGVKNYEAIDAKYADELAAAEKEGEEATKAVQDKIAKEKGNYDPKRFIEVVKLAAEKSNWKNRGDKHLGFSVYYSHNTYVAEVAEVTFNNGKPKIENVVCAVDCGIVINPVAATNLIEGGVVDGVGHSMYGDFGFENGVPTANNFDKYRLIRTNEAPKVQVYFVENGESPTGLGEPTFPPAGAAVANAIYSATKKRLYKQPYIKDKALLG